MAAPSLPPTSDVADTSPASIWRRRDFVLLWGGQSVSALGSTISDIALALLVLSISHSASQVAFIASVEAVPFLFLTLPAGALMDRWDRKRIMLVCDVGRAICLGSIALALAFGHLLLLQLYIVALAEGSLATLYNLAALAGMHRVVPTGQLGQASSASYISSNTASLVGPPLGSWLLTVASAAPFVADALSYLASVASLRGIRSAFQGSRTDAGEGVFQNVAASLIGGLMWMWKQPVLRFQALAGCVVSFALYPTTPLAIALAAHLRAPQASIGIIFSIGAVGGLAGGLVGAWLQRHLRFGRLMVLHFGLLALLFLCYIAASNVVWLGICLAAISLVAAVGGIANIAYRLAQTPDEYQGRINSIHRFLGFGVGRPLGAALLGVLLTHLGLNVAIVIFAGVLAIFALATAIYVPVQAVAPLE